MAFSIGLGLSVTRIGGATAEGVEWTPALLFSSPDDGFWAGGFSPPAFTPELLFDGADSGFLVRGFTPPPWVPAMMFEGADSGFLVNGFKPEAE